MISETVQLALISAFVPTITVIGTWIQQRRALTRVSETATAAKGTAEETHKIVNSQRTEMLASIETLKGEIGRLNLSPGGTPATVAPVVLKDGVVTVSAKS